MNNGNWDEIELEPMAGEAGEKTQQAVLDGEPHPDNLSDSADESNVVDVETKGAPKKNYTMYIILAVVAVVVCSLLWAIGSRMKEALYPSTKNLNAATESRSLEETPLAAGNQGSALMGGGTSQENMMPGGGAPGGDVLLQSGANPADMVAPPPPGVNAMVAPAAGQPEVVQTAPVVVSPPAASVVAAPVQNVAPAVVAQGPDASSKEVERLKAELQARDREVSFLKQERDDFKVAAEKSSAAAAAAARNAPPAPAVAKPKSEKKPRQPKAHRGTSDAPVDVAEAAARPAKAAKTSKGKARKESVLIDEAKGETGRLLLSNYKIYAMYPNKGDHQAAHIVDSNGRVMVKRAGDSIDGARVLKVDSATWTVQTTDGEIR